MSELRWQILGDPTGQTYTAAELERVANGRSAVLVEDESQPPEAERLEFEQRRQRAALEAQQRAYDRSPAGRREAAMRAAMETPGGRVTVVGDEPDAFRTSRETDPLCGRWL
jgi:hypothetical protein